MENNNANAVSTQPQDSDAPLEGDKVKVEPEEDAQGQEKVPRPNQRRRPFRREVKLEEETGKWAIRRKIWDHLEDNNLVNTPRPCHYRIPNFEGAAQANDRLTGLEAFKQAKTVKVNPDKPQEQARFLVLEAEKELILLNQRQKSLLVPTPQLKTGLLNRVVPPVDANKDQLRHCCTSQGVKDNSVEVGLESTVKLDMIFVGSVAVSRKGYRIGKGKGYADLEYAMMRTMGAADEKTVVVTSVHDSQVVDIDEELVEEHDLTVDYILTPTELIETNCQRPKPEGVIWNHLEVTKFFQIPVLRQLRDIERENGKNVQLKDQKEEDEDPLDSQEPPRQRRYRYSRGGYRGGRGQRPSRYRRGGGGGRRRPMDSEDSNKENVETGDESGPDGDHDGRGRRPRNYRNRRFRRGGKLRVSESEHSDGGVEGGQGDGDDRPRQRGYPNRRRFNTRRRRFEGSRRGEHRGYADHSGSDGEQKTSGDEDGEGYRSQSQRPRFRTNPDAVVFLGSLSRRIRVSELKTELRSNNIAPQRLLWRGGRGFAFLFFMDVDAAKDAVSSLSGKEMDGKEIKVEMANYDRPPRRRGGQRSERGEDLAEDDGAEVNDR